MHLQATAFAHKNEHFRWSASIAGFGMLLKNSKHKGTATWPMVCQIAQNSKGHDKHGYRAECIQLMETAQAMQMTQ